MVEMEQERCFYHIYTMDEMLRCDSAFSILWVTYVTTAYESRFECKYILIIKQDSLDNVFKNLKHILSSLF